MKSMKQLLAACWVALVVGFAGAEPAICVNSVHQRYPWNGMVDVNYTVTGLDATHSYKLRFRVTAPGGEPKMFTASSSPTADGTYTAAFSAAASNAYPDAFIRNLSLVASLVDVTQGGVLPPDATGTPIGTAEAKGDVMVIDVSGGPSVAIHPVEYYYDVDMGCFNCSVYKTDKIVLRWIPEGGYWIGDDKAEASPRRIVTTRGFYIGLFEVTQGQYEYVMGKEANHSHNTSDAPPDDPRVELPVDSITASIRREEAANSPVPSANGSFLQRLNAKAARGRERLSRFDLPTGAQWEIACRAGTTSTYFWGDNSLDVVSYAWCKVSSGTGSHAVGRKRPNNWGLYDCIGNVLECCREPVYKNASWYSSNADADVVFGWGGYEESAVRGGSWYYNLVSPSYMNANTAGGHGYDNGFHPEWLYYWDVGFRLCYQPRQ